MRKERRTEIKLITKRSITIHSSRALTAWCLQCGREVAMFTPGQAALISGLRAREVYGRAEAGEIHFTETVEGLLLVCLDSLLGYRLEGMNGTRDLIDLGPGDGELLP